MKTTTKIILLLLLSWSDVFAQSSAPVADFNMSDTMIYASDTVFFTDVSSNTPTSWSWNIQGGSPPSSTIANPYAVFSTPGNYNITLTVSNAYGMDTITKVIHVVEFVTLMCTNGTNQTVTYPSGSFYDSGGPSGNYGASENCSILISPGSCVDSITLTFNTFSSDPWSDYLRVFDGTSASGNMLLSHSGFTVPPPVTATSGSMLITWISDLGLESGYHASWQTYYGSSAAPVANFSFNPNNVPILDTVTFTNLSTNIYSSSWDFGDGSTSNLDNPKHAYSLPGTYTVTLIAQSCTSADTVTQSVTVQPAPNIDISPNSLNLSMACNDTVTVPIQISNLGLGTLNWSVGPQGAMDLLVWYYGADTSNAVSSAYQNTMGAIRQAIPNVSYDSTATTDWTVLQNALVGKNVLLIPKLRFALADTISIMKNVVHDFMKNGGTVVVCEDNQLKVVGNLELFDHFQSNSYNSTILLDVVNTSTQLTQGISTSTINGESLTVSLATVDPSYIPILKLGNESVCMYRDIGLGKAIYFGFDMESYNADMQKILVNAVLWTLNSLDLSPASGTLVPGGTDTAYLAVTSTGLMAGSDTSYIIVNSNDPSNLVDSIPVYINMTSDICVDFDTIVGACNGMVQFTDLSIHTPTSWFWDFGDGSTSTAQNPTHTYSSNGTYTVTLIASNATSTDSVTKVVDIITGVGPISSRCSIYTGMSCCQFGLTHFGLGNINRTSLDAETEGCVDFTCTDSTTLIPGNTYTYSLTVSSVVSRFILAIDTNNDGIISDFEYFVDTLIENLGVSTGTVQIPPNVQTGIPLRLRIFAGVYYSLGNGDICNNILQHGQTEDYTVRFAYPDGITIYSDNDDISVYPIPFSSMLNIDFKDLQYADKLKIQLINTLGQIIYHQDFDRLDLSSDLSITPDLAPGIYNLRIFLDDKLYDVRVMKE